MSKPKLDSDDKSPGSLGRGAQPERTYTYTLKATGDAAKNFDFLAARPPGKRTNQVNQHGRSELRQSAMKYINVIFANVIDKEWENHYITYLIRLFAFLSDLKEKNSFIESVAHLVKSALGGGVVSIHSSYYKCGLWTAVGLNICFGLLVAYLMYVLAKCAQKAYGRTNTAKMSYPDLAQCAFEISKFPRLRKHARLFRHIVDGTIMIDLFGSCCCYQILISKTIQKVLSIYASKEIPLRIVIACILVPCILICLILTLKYLAPFSIAADIVIVAVGIATIVYGSKNAALAGRKPTDMEPFNDMKGLLNFMGVCVFSMEGVGATLPVENNMKNPKRVGQVVLCGESIIISMVMLVGFFGCWGYAEKVDTPVTINFPNSPEALMLKIGLALMVYVTFAINFWVPFELAWVYLKKLHRDTSRPKTIQRIYRLIFVIIITFVSIVFPAVNDLMGVIGAFCLSNMGFIYPSIIQLLLDWEDPGLGKMKWRLWRFLMIFIFSIILMVVATITNIISMVEELYLKK